VSWYAECNSQIKTIHIMKNLLKLFKKNLLIWLLILSGCQARNDLATLSEGQEPIESLGPRRMDTQTVPIQLQYKATFDIGNGVFFSNEFEGARMNGIARTNDTLITLLITPENTPINESPWYAFKVWSSNQQNIYIKLTYQVGIFHRYYPKLSRDRKIWQKLDSMDYQENLKKNAEGIVEPENVTFKVSVGPDTLFVAAQEIITSDDVEKWIEKMTIYPYVRWQNIGESTEGRPLHLLKVGESDDKRMIMVISRQHPPEVTGFMAMQSFVETICGNSEIASEFRKQYSTYVVPLVNPDGVANGHWRHNAGGIDLNRDWFDFNQPETTAIRDFMKNKTKSSEGKFYFSIDFHSMGEDLYYTINPLGLKGNMPGLVPGFIEAYSKELPGYKPNIKPNTRTEQFSVASSFIFHEFGAEAVCYEVGYNTPRDFIKKKGEVAALKLMELMIGEQGSY
jgi:cytosolic carboxypeptidase protein 6